MLNNLGGNTRLHWYAIEKKEVVNKDFRGINKLVKSMELLGSKSCQAVNLSFSGYDDDPREIFEIEEIRRFVKILLQKHPHIFYFLECNFSQCLQNIILCYADFETFFVGEKKAINEYPLEDIINNKLPQQEVMIQVSPIKIEAWKKEVVKTAKKFNDIDGGEKVCQNIESIFSAKF